MLMNCWGVWRGKVREKMREHMQEKEEEERVRVLLRGVVISSVPVIFSTLISFLFLISTAMNKLQEIWILHEGLDSLFKGVHSIYV